PAPPHLHSFPTRRSSDLGDRFPEARRTLDLAAAESTRTGAFRPLLRTLFFAGLARANLGDFGGALRALERKRRLLEEKAALALEDRKSTRLNSSHVAISY